MMTGAKLVHINAGEQLWNGWLVCAKGDTRGEKGRSGESWAQRRRKRAPGRPTVQKRVAAAPSKED